MYKNSLLIRQFLLVASASILLIACANPPSPVPTPALFFETSGATGEGEGGTATGEEGAAGASEQSGGEGAGTEGEEETPSAESGSGGASDTMTQTQSITGTEATTATAGSAAPVPTQMSEQQLISLGEQVYAANCASCHQNNGQGTSSYPALANNPFVASEDPTALIQLILQGRGQMPSFEDILSSQQIAGVSSYIRSNWGNEASVVRTAQVRQVKQGGQAVAAAGGQTGSGESGGTADAQAASNAMTSTQSMTETGQITGTSQVTETGRMAEGGQIAETGQITATGQLTAQETPAPGGAAGTPTVTATLRTAAGVTWTPAPVVSETVTTTAASSGAEVGAGTATPPTSGDQAAASQPVVTATPMSDQQLLTMGEQVYASNCASCHQENGRGTNTYPALRGSQLVSNEEPTQVIEIVLNGRGQMPAFDDTLSNQEIAAVVSHIRNSWGNEASLVRVAQVRQVAGGASASASSAMTGTSSSSGTATVTQSNNLTQTEEITQTGEITPNAQVTASATIRATQEATNTEAITATQTVTGTRASTGTVTSAQTITGTQTITDTRTPAAASQTMTATQDIAATGTPTATVQAGATVTGTTSAQAQPGQEGDEEDNQESEGSSQQGGEESGGTEGDTASQTPLSEEELVATGADLYTRYCAACHQAQGTGVAGAYPPLAGNPLVTSEEPSALIQVVVTGRAGMPRFADILSDQEIAAILSHVRTSWNNGAAVVNVEPVSQVRARFTSNTEAVEHSTD